MNDELLVQRVAQAIANEADPNSHFLLSTAERMARAAIAAVLTERSNGMMNAYPSLMEESRKRAAPKDRPSA